MSNSSTSSIDVEDLSLQNNIKRLEGAIKTAKQLKRTHATLEYELSNYTRLLDLHRERRAYDKERARRRALRRKKQP